MEHKIQIIVMNQETLVGLYGADAAAEMLPYRQAVCDSCGWQGVRHGFDPNVPADTERSIDKAGNDQRHHRESPETNAPKTVPWESVVGQ